MSIESYRQISESYDTKNLKRSVVLKKAQPIATGIFGMVKLLIIDKLQTPTQRERRNQKVKDHFLQAIKLDYGERIEELARNMLDTYQGKALKARDVCNMLDFADGKRIGEISEPIAELLGPVEAEECEKTINGTQSRKFMVYNKLSKNEMIALLCITGMVENKNVTPAKLKSAMENEGHYLTPIVKNLDSALNKLPPHKGTVYTARPLIYKESIKDFAVSKGAKRNVELLQINEALNDREKGQLTKIENSSNIVLTIFKSKNGRLLQFGNKSVDKEFIVFPKGSVLNKTGVGQLGTTIKTESQDEDIMYLFQPGAIRLSYEEA